MRCCRLVTVKESRFPCSKKPVLSRPLRPPLNRSVKKSLCTLSPLENDPSVGLELQSDLSDLKQALRAPPALRSREAEKEAELEELDYEGVFPERVLLVGVAGKRSETGSYSLHESLEELGSLAVTAGLKVVRQVYQFVDAPSPATYIGSGKLTEIKEIVTEENISTVIFDVELSPVQLMNVEKTLG